MGLPLLSSGKQNAVVSTRDWRVFGLSPLSGIVRNTTFRNLDLFPSVKKERTLVTPLTGRGGGGGGNSNLVM
jgi:hypothetical protein